MVKGICVPADDSEALQIRELETLEDYREAVDGCIEAVDVPDLGVTIYVNEEGLISRLPFNPRASFLWWYHVPGAHKAMLVGNAVIVGLPDENGDSTDLSQGVVNLLTRTGEYAVAVQMGGTFEPSWPDGKLSSVLLPLMHGDPSWCLSLIRHEDYFSAAAWAVVFRERWTDAVNVRVVSAVELPRRMQILMDDLPHIG
ncbi:protein of unknown function [Propionibacterium cyclohexanicum]|uniref:DUF3846 domain-containing protein n=1 Tax=Propionibacterium cyclohexanicum TaxID=64702 RepID=A0A1H9PXQ4_9ACTN|nr:DUF3846 domain-containing protein [Propionibacterium cyclohexanicum]SER52962.1 protein of unknown function [Propionibacterium cyclohexanicum]